MTMMYTLSMKTCSIDNCDAPFLAQGRCRFHYHQGRYRGEIQKLPTGMDCSAPDCDRVANGGNGLCSMHYQRMRLYGRLERLTLAPDSERFWSKVDKSGDCWIWMAGQNNRYGAFHVGSKRLGSHKMVSAHRYSYEQNIGPIPEGMFVCHTCDNPPCVRPEHLFLGTAKENAVDMVVKGRHKNCPHDAEIYRIGLLYSDDPLARAGAYAD